MSDQAQASTCQSSSMTIESGDYCSYCTNEDGGLLSFDETFERFVQFAMGRDTSMDRDTAEAIRVSSWGGCPRGRTIPPSPGSISSGRARPRRLDLTH